MPAKTPKNSRATVWLADRERAELREFAHRLDLSESQALRRGVRLLLSEQQGREQKGRARVGP
jgi:hypothetical protein